MLVLLNWIHHASQPVSAHAADFFLGALWQRVCTYERSQRLAHFRFVVDARSGLICRSPKCSNDTERTPA